MQGFLNWSFRLYRAFGIDVRVHWTLPLVAFFQILQWSRVSHPEYGSYYGALLMGILSISVLIHEYGHAFAAKFIGVQADTIVLWPLGGLTMREATQTQRGEVFIAFAGPAVGMLVGGLCLGVSGIMGEEITLQTFDPFHGWGNLWQDALKINIIINAANLLIPAQPFDGGTIWTGILTPAVGYLRALKITTTLGLIIGVAAIAAGFWLRLVDLGFMGLWIIVSCLLIRAQIRAGMINDYASTYAESLDPHTEPAYRPGFFARWKMRREAKRRARQRSDERRLRQEVDVILDKVKREGMNALTPRERAALNEASKRLRDSEGGDGGRFPPTADCELPTVNPSA